MRCWVKQVREGVRGQSIPSAGMLCPYRFENKRDCGGSLIHPTVSNAKIIQISPIILQTKSNALPIPFQQKPPEHSIPYNPAFHNRHSIRLTGV